MLRADIDGLPVTDATGLPYASTVKAKDDDGVQLERLRVNAFGIGFASKCSS